MACLVTLNLLSSCKEEEILFGNHFAILDILVLDTSGRNAVFQWYETSEDMKGTTAEVIESKTRPSHYDFTVACIGSEHPEKSYFRFDNVLDLFKVGDSVTWRFRMYPDDVEEIIFEGKCVKPNKKGGNDTEMQWTFHGVDLSIENPKHVTLIRTEDGCYTLKQ